MPYKLFGYELDFYTEYRNFRSDIDRVRMEMSKTEVDKLKAEIDGQAEATEKLYYVENGNAHIPILGSLSNKVDYCAYLFGENQTLYSDIIEQTKLANEDWSVNKIIYDVDSPGGTVDGVELAADAIRNSKKPTESHVYNKAASAAYWLISQTGKIYAMDRTTEVGSIGVVVELIDTSKKDEKNGIKRSSITSTGAPDKRLDLTNEDGQKKLIARLDDVHKVFVETVAAGRKTTVEDVQNNFGKGGMLIAEKALEAGMIDGIIIKGKKIKETNPVNSGEKIKEDSNMNLNEFLEQNPEAKAEYDKIVKAAVDDGVNAAQSNSREILECSGVAKETLELSFSGISAEKWALEERKKANAVGAASGSNDLGKGLSKPAQLPKDSVVDEDKAQADAWDELYGVNKEDE